MKNSVKSGIALAFAFSALSFSVTSQAQVQEEIDLYSSQNQETPKFLSERPKSLQMPLEQIPATEIIEKDFEILEWTRNTLVEASGYSSSRNNSEEIKKRFTKNGLSSYESYTENSEDIRIAKEKKVNLVATPLSEPEIYSRGYIGANKAIRVMLPISLSIDNGTENKQKSAVVKATIVEIRTKDNALELILDNITVQSLDSKL